MNNLSVRNAIVALELSNIVTVVCRFLLSCFIAAPAFAGELGSLKGYTQKDILEFVSDQSEFSKNNIQISKPSHSIPSKEMVNQNDVFDGFKRAAKKFELKSLNMTNGGMDGGGGDSRSQEFFKIGNDLLRDMESKKQSLVDVEALKIALSLIEVEFTDKELILDGRLKEAINYPREYRIIVSSSAWKNIATIQKKSALILHELLGIVGANDQGYIYSSAVLGQTDLKYVHDFSKVEALPGSYLDSYDRVAAQLAGLWNKNSRDPLIREFSIETIKTFYGFSSVKIKSNDFGSTQTAYYLATHLRDLAPYNPNLEAFLRVGDNFPIYATQETKKFGINRPKSLHLVIGKNEKHAYEYFSSEANIIDKITGNKIPEFGCRIRLPRIAEVSYHGAGILKQFFSLAVNCGGTYYEVDTNIPIY